MQKHNTDYPDAEPKIRITIYDSLHPALSRAKPKSSPLRNIPFRWHFSGKLFPPPPVIRKGKICPHTLVLNTCRFDQHQPYLYSQPKFLCTFCMLLFYPSEGPLLHNRYRQFQLLPQHTLNRRLSENTQWLCICPFRRHDPLHTSNRDSAWIRYLHGKPPFETIQKTVLSSAGYRIPTYIPLLKFFARQDWMPGHFSPEIPSLSTDPEESERLLNIELPHTTHFQRHPPAPCLISQPDRFRRFQKDDLKQHPALLY